jgi:hypothetical protein
MTEIKMEEKILVPTFFITGPPTPDQFERIKEVKKRLAEASMKDWMNEVHQLEGWETLEYKSIDEISKEQ